MASYLKILLLFIFVAAPALDIAFLDNKEPPNHIAESFHNTENQVPLGDTDLHCICHVIHHGMAFGKAVNRDVVALSDVTWPIAEGVLHGLHPKPGLHPPSTQLS